MPKQFLEVPVEELRAHVDPETLPFENTGSLDSPPEPVLGQERASDALKFGIGMKSRNYHIYIAGPPSAGLTYTAKTYLKEQAKGEPTPPDWCYVHNFEQDHRPKAIRLPPGQGIEFQKEHIDDFKHAGLTFKRSTHLSY